MSQGALRNPKEPYETLKNPWESLNSGEYFKNLQEDQKLFLDMPLALQGI